MNVPSFSSRKKWGAASAGLLAAMLFAFSGSASAGIADTKHNLGTGGAGNHTSAGTAEICVFCHTPHGGSTTAPAPLWNKRLGSAGGTTSGVGTYTTYASLNSPSIDGTIVAVGSISVACLSCHDGTQAMDNIINAPGSGGYDSTGGGTNGLGWTWTAAGLEGVMAAGIANLGTDLSNDHPIGIAYCGGGITGGTGSSVTGTCTDQDFTAPLTASINSNQVFWIDTGGTGKQRTDLPLYTRDSGATGPQVECGSCHDPHVSSGLAGPTGTGQTSGATFLRISNAGSAVCLTCHTK